MDFCCIFMDCCLKIMASGYKAIYFTCSSFLNIFPWPRRWLRWYKIVGAIWGGGIFPDTPTWSFVIWIVGVPWNEFPNHSVQSSETPSNSLVSTRNRSYLRSIGACWGFEVLGKDDHRCHTIFWCFDVASLARKGCSQISFCPGRRVVTSISGLVGKDLKQRCQWGSAIQLPAF